MNKTKIIFNKKEICFHFGLGFMGDLLDSLNISIQELFELLDKNPFKIVPSIMHVSHSYNQKRIGLESDYSLYDFIDFIDDDGGITSSKTVSFLKAFTDSISKNVPKNDTKKEDVEEVVESTEKPTPKKK